MTIENVYSYLEYLSLTVDQLADAVVEREEETAMYEVRLKELCEEIVSIRKDIDKAEARAQLAEANARKSEDKIQELVLQLKSAKQNSRKQSAQIDLFTPQPVPPEQHENKALSPVSTKSNRVANDESALILAQKLDSTIDKVQRLIREARA